MHRKYILDKFGEQGLDTLLLNAKEETRAIFKGVIDVHRWYDLDALSDFLVAFDKTYGREEMKGLAAFTLDKQVNGLYGLILRFISVESLKPRVQEMWEKYYSPGKFALHIDGKELIFTISEFKMTDLHITGMMFWFQAFIEKIERKKYICSFRRVNKEIEMRFLPGH